MTAMSGQQLNTQWGCRILCVFQRVRSFDFKFGLFRASLAFDSLVHSLPKIVE